MRHARVLRLEPVPDILFAGLVPSLDPAKFMTVILREGACLSDMTGEFYPEDSMMSVS
jgi:hypothetical protein